MGTAVCGVNYGECFFSLCHSIVATHCVSSQANNLLKKRFPPAANKLKHKHPAKVSSSILVFSLRKTSNHNESFGSRDPLGFVALQKHSFNFTPL